MTLSAPPGRQGGDAADPRTVRAVVLNFNGGDDVVASVGALRAAPPADPHLDLEVVVVDNASTDGSVEALRRRFPDLVVVHNPTNTGFPANNLALRDLEGVRAVALVNPDVFVEPGWLDPLLAALDAEPTLGAACPLMLFHDRFVDVEVVSTTSVPGDGDARELGIQVVGARVAGADVWPGVRVGGVDFGPEQGPLGMFRWTGDRTVLRVPVPPEAAAAEGSVVLAVTCVLGERTVSFTSGDDRIDRTVGTEVEHVEVPLAGPRYDLVNNAGSIVFDDGYGADRAYLERVGPEVEHDAEVFAFSGGAVLLRPSFLQEVGVLDRRFFLYYEDTDLSWRGVARGWRYRYVPASRVRHRHSAIVGEGSPMARYYNERNRLMMLAKNAPAPLLAGQAAAFAGGIASSVATVGTRLLRHRGHPVTADRADLASAWLRARALVGVVAQAPFLARRRRDLRRHQTVDDAAVVARLVRRG